MNTAAVLNDFRLKNCVIQVFQILIEKQGLFVSSLANIDVKGMRYFEMVSVSLFRPTVTRRDKKSGEKVAKKTKVWWMAWRDPDLKKRCTASTGTKNKQLANQKAREQQDKLYRIAQGWYHPAESHCDKTLESAIEEFLKSSRARHRFQTTDAYRISLSVFQRNIECELLKQVTLNVIEAFINTRSEKVLPTTINKDLRHLRAFLNWAGKLNYIATIPELSGLFLPTDQSDPVMISEDDIKAVLRALKQPNLKLFQAAEWWQVYVQLALFLGARRGELLGLKWSDVSFKEQSIKIRRETSKGRRDRTYESVTALMPLLKDWYESAAPVPVPTDSVLPWSHTTRRQLYVDWKRVLKAAGIEPERYFKLHNFRSTCVSELLESESSFTVRDWVGHASVTTTEKHYANTKKARREVASKRQVR
jgi:integrase